MNGAMRMVAIRSRLLSIVRVAMMAGMALTGGTARELMEEGRRLNDSMGAVNILPQLLASLGVVFTAAKVGDLIANGIQRIIPDNSLFPLVLANCLGMTLFTLVMGNSFAAFPVIASGVLIPLIVRPYGADRNRPIHPQRDLAARTVERTVDKMGAGRGGDLEGVGEGFLARGGKVAYRAP